MGIHGPPAAGRVNINTASVEMLRDEVKGIGQVLAERIVAYREANGPFRSFSELERVQGIGSAMLSRLADQLTVGEHVGDVDLAGSGTAGTTIPIAEQMPHLPAGAGEPIVVAHVERPSTGPEEDKDMVDAEDVRPLPEEDDQVPQAEEAAESADEQLTPVEEEELPGGELEADTAPEEEQLEGVAEDEPSEAEAELEPVEVEAEVPALVAETELLPVENDAWPEEELPCSEEEEPLLAEEAALAEEAEPMLVEDGGTPVAPEGEMAFVVAEEEPEEAPALEEAPPLAEEEPFVVQEAEPVLATAAVGAAAAEAAEPKADAYTPRETRATAPVVTETVRASRGSFWHDLGLVVLGGVLGLVLTLAVFALLSGTVDYATRREFDALSRNADIIQSNFQVAWDRVSNLEQRADTMQNELVPLAPLPGRMDLLERSVEQAQGTLDAVESDVQALTTQTEALQSSMAAMEQQVSVLTEDVVAMRASLDEMQSAFDAVQERVVKFDAFFAALRDLLVDLNPAEGEAAPEAEAEAAATEEAQPEETPAPTATPAG